MAYSTQEVQQGVLDVSEASQSANCGFGGVVLLTLPTSGIGLVIPKIYMSCRLKRQLQAERSYVTGERLDYMHPHVYLHYKRRLKTLSRPRQVKIILVKSTLVNGCLGMLVQCLRLLLS